MPFISWPQQPTERDPGWISAKNDISEMCVRVREMLSLFSPAPRVNIKHGPNLSRKYLTRSLRAFVSFTGHQSLYQYANTRSILFCPMYVVDQQQSMRGIDCCFVDQPSMWRRLPKPEFEFKNEHVPIIVANACSSRARAVCMSTKTMYLVLLD